MNRRSAVTRPLDGHSDWRLSLSLLAGRPAAWLFALWSGYIATWAIVSNSSPLVVAAWWLAGICLAQAIERPLSRNRRAEPAQLLVAALAPSAAEVFGLQAVAVEDWESEGGAIS
jgi:hypothetical protein